MMNVKVINCDGEVREEVVVVEGNDLEEMICNYNEIEELNWEKWIGGVYENGRYGSILWVSDEVVVEYRLK